MQASDFLLPGYVNLQQLWLRPLKSSPLQGEAGGVLAKYNQNLPTPLPSVCFGRTKEGILRIHAHMAEEASHPATISNIEKFTGKVLN